MSTLPKSIQAQMGHGAGDRDESTSGIATQRNAQQHFKEFIDKYKHLPDDFLRLPTSLFPQQDINLSISYNRPEGSGSGFFGSTGSLVDMIDISVVEAQLVKNYGLLRMDLYCKIRVGHMVCETHTCLNGAKNPKWDGVYQFSLKPGIDSFHLEIYDENQFKADEKIAWLYEPIPPEVFQGITVERWFPLSGRLGPNKEGSVLLVISHKRVPMRSSHSGRLTAGGSQHHPSGAPMAVFIPPPPNQAPIITSGALPPGAVPIIDSGPGGPLQAYIQPGPPPSTLQNDSTQNPDVTITLQQQEQAAQQIRDVDVNQLSEMFPSIDKAIIRAVLENNHNDKEAAIGALLALG